MSTVLRALLLATAMFGVSAYNAPMSRISQSAVGGASPLTRAVAARSSTIKMDEVEDKVMLRREHKHLQRTRARTHMRRRASDWAAMRP